MFRTTYTENALRKWLEEALQQSALRAGQLSNRIKQPAIPGHADERKRTPWDLNPYTPYTNDEIAPLPNEIQTAGHLAREFNAQREPYLQRAQEYVTQGAQSFPENYQAYMNPYQQNVVNNIASLGNRNFNEKILPQIEAQFIGAGMGGGERHQDLLRRAARDLQESIMREQDKALHQGYQTAGTLFGTDKARQMEAAKLTGDISEANRLGTSAAIQNLMSTGNYSQQQEQRKLDLEKQKFLRQKDYPWELIGREMSVLSGIPPTNVQTQHMQSTPTPVVNAAGNIGSIGLQGAGFMMGQNPINRSRGGAVRQISRALRNYGV